MGAGERKRDGITRGVRSVCLQWLYNNVKATKAAFTPDGWFKTGDLGLLDFNRRLRLTLTGREKDSVIINGLESA
ncbi:hypothetical protein VC83_08280 [Pseudogymnoascus destructans]|uniref:AMP-dependent synthetase/ligase domain-containing protein n=1 Tax=Pseudogymnoascus destructans TaxID=655981 RepID=A0A177A316_9PEZI|nr:uncharacterized protein VC83_08280 [Pseudogymnoascus destructans]OAF55483.1 hypothetical protein VC83_08280 [Pseudogymnoascus destructans]